MLKRLPVGIIAFTGKPTSPLAMAADQVINIHTDREACPLGLAPTSSAVNTLIMGDALAIALMRSRNFSEHIMPVRTPAAAWAPACCAAWGYYAQRGETTAHHA